MTNSIVALCKRRGFIFQSSDIYSGLQGVYDYGPMGVELKNNLKSAWWRSMVYERGDVEGLDSAIITHRLTLKHSGHEDTFCDPMVDCRDCKYRMRIDHILDGKCDNCQSDNLTEVRNFNLMLKTNLGPVDDGSGLAYLRPETAQGIFVNFKNVVDATSRKLPFGIAQIGKAFRNEVTPRHFIFRMREFEQAELEFFVEPGTDDEWHRKWIDIRFSWWIQQGLSYSNLRLQHQTRSELAHYAKATTDILYNFKHGWDELEGIANRTDFDLGSHTKNEELVRCIAKVAPNNDSVMRLAMKKQINNEKSGEFFVPFVIEPSAGIDRGVFAILSEAFTVEKLDNGTERIVLKLKPHLAPIKVAVVPLARNNNDIRIRSEKIVQILRKSGIGRIGYEDSGNVGKAYRRHDELGTPYCVTVDFETLDGIDGGSDRGSDRGSDGGNNGDGIKLNDNETVTLRERDSMKQTRVRIGDLVDMISVAMI